MQKPTWQHGRNSGGEALPHPGWETVGDLGMERGLGGGQRLPQCQRVCPPKQSRSSVETGLCILKRSSTSGGAAQVPLEAGIPWAGHNGKVLLAIKSSLLKIF